MEHTQKKSQHGPRRRYPVDNMIARVLRDHPDSALFTATIHKLSWLSQRHPIPNDVVFALLLLLQTNLQFFGLMNCMNMMQKFGYSRETAYLIAAYYHVLRIADLTPPYRPHDSLPARQQQTAQASEEQAQRPPRQSRRREFTRLPRHKKTEIETPDSEQSQGERVGVIPVGDLELPKN